MGRVRRAGLNSADEWRALQSVDAYRLLVASGLVLCIALQADNALFGPSVYPGFRSAALAYFGAAAVALIAGLARRPSIVRHMVAAAAVDIVALCGLAATSQGAASGLGMLLLLPIAAAGLLLNSRMAAFIAACAAIGMLAQAAIRALVWPEASADFFLAGLTGAYYFIAAAVAHWLARYLDATRAVALFSASRARRFRELNHRIIEHIDTGTLVVDIGGTVRLTNSAACRLLGIEQAETEGRPLVEAAPALASGFIAWQQADELPAGIVRVGSQNILPTFAYLEKRAGSDVLISLEDADRQSEQAQQLKLASLGRLTASVAHEIRNPLSAIGHAEQLLAESSQLTSGDRKLLDIVARHVARIDDITARMLGLARRSQAQRERMALTEWLETLVAEYQELHDDAPQFDLTGVGDNVRVDFDPAHLHQILTNLWDNARRHARRDEHPLRLTLTSGTDADGRAFLDNADNGPGLAPGALGNVLEPFFTTARDGTGLGLHIARELCEANGARLAPVANDDGARFRLTFGPRRAAAAPAPETLAS